MSSALSIFHAYKTLYEMIPVRKGQMVFAEEHLFRINASAKELGLPFSVRLKDLSDHLADHAPESADTDLRLIISPAGIRIDLLSPAAPLLLPKAEGLVLAYSELQRSESSPYVRHLTPANGDLFLERSRLADLEADDLVFLNSRWEICESTCANIFFRKEGTFYTPPLSCGLIPGILREYLIKNYTVKEEVLHPEDLWRMDGCFLAASSIGILPVRKLAGCIWTV